MTLAIPYSPAHGITNQKYILTCKSVAAAYIERGLTGSGIEMKSSFAIHNIFTNLLAVDGTSRGVRSPLSFSKFPI